MKIAKPHVKTAEKYRLYLKSLLIKINNIDFNEQEFIDHGCLPSRFIICCIDLGYVTKCRRKLSSLFDYKNVTIVDGWIIAKAILEYNIKHSSYYKKGDYMVPSVNDLMNGRSIIYAADLPTKKDVSTETKVKKVLKKDFTLNVFGWKITLAKK